MIGRLLSRWFGCPGRVEGLNRLYEWRCQRCRRLYRRPLREGSSW